MKRKFRIVSENGAARYAIEKTSRVSTEKAPHWIAVAWRDNLEDAELKIRELVANEEKEPTGTVIKEYSVDDLIVDRLRGKI